MSRYHALVDAVEAKLADATVKFVKGPPNRVGQHGQRRRVHWYTVGGIVEPTAQAGGREIDAGTQRSPSVHQRTESIEVLVFAENLTTLDVLFDNIIVAISQVAPAGQAQFGDYSYGGDEQYAQRIPYIALQVQLRMPVQDAVRPLTPITDEELTCQIES